MDHIHPVLLRCLQHRGAATIKDISNPIAALHAPHTLKNIDAFCQIFYTLWQHQARIIVVGDYDCDGATSTALAVNALRMLGYQHVDYIIPDRFTFGYGLSEQLVEHIHATLPDTQALLTVDNGTASIDGVNKAKSFGWQVAVTDHHLPGTVLPQADTIVNPQLDGDRFPSKALAGVGVVFYCMLALRDFFSQQGFYRSGTSKPNFATLLDLVAFGTVADCVPLDSNNRILVHHGLKRMRNKKACPGIMSLIDVCGIDAKNLTAKDISFRLAPKLNAAGRLQDMGIGVECLLAINLQIAYQHAQHLIELNTSRQDLQQDMLAAASKQLLMRASGERGVCLENTSWHQGIIGILASRLKEMTYEPTIVFAHENKETLKGSCRSIAGIHIRDVLARIAQKHPSILQKFGGHAMAAGLSIRTSDYPAFKTLFHQQLADVAHDVFTPVLETDGPLQACELQLDTAEVLQAFGIWGQAFPEPVFENTFTIYAMQYLKQVHLKLRLKHLVSDRNYLDAIWFNCPASVKAIMAVGRELCIYYKLSINANRTKRTLCLQIVHACCAPASCNDAVSPATRFCDSNSAATVV